MTPKRPSPPKWAERFLEWYCAPCLLEDLQGDLHERFIARTRSMSLARAKLLYIWDVIVFFKPYTFNKNHKASFFFLFRSYIKPSYRSLLKSKLHTSLNICGLTISMLAFIFILLYVDDELKYDRHYDKSERIYKIYAEVNSPTANSLVVWTDGYLGQRLKESYVEVEESVEMVRLTGKISVQYDDKKFLEDRLYRAERTYFSIFSHTWIAGNPKTALAEPGSVVLTKKLAEKYFGEQTPVNKIIKIGEADFAVTGVIENLPAHTDLKFDALLSTDHEYLSETNYWCITFILLKNEVNTLDFEKKINEISQQFQEDEVAGTDATISYRMEALPDVHFGKPKLFDTPKSSRSNIYIFSSVAFFILVIAGINYTNLAIVQALKRYGEAGIRKILGALPSQLVKQHLVEIFMVCSFSFIVAGILALLFLPFLNHLTGKDLSPYQFLNFQLLLILFLVVFLMALVAGSYPAMLLSTVKPAQALKGHKKIIRTNRFRNALIAFQFTASVTLIICTKIVYDQWNVLTQTNPGFNKEQVLVIDVPKEQASAGVMLAVKNDFSILPFVRKASLVGYNSLPTSSMDIDSYEVEQNGENTTRIFNNISVDEDYLNLFEIDIVLGRNLTPQEVEIGSGSIVVNESLVNAVGWDHPLDQVLYVNSSAYEIVGVAKDFHFNSLHKIIEPIVIHGSNDHPEKLLVKVDQLNFQRIQLLEEQWEKIVKAPFNFEFLDSYFNDQYKNEMTMHKVLQYFAVFTLIIACLGLFGLVALSTAQRTREFGIRKVLGAKFPNIALLVLKEFSLLVALGAALSVPLAWWGVTTWLEEFAYRTTLAISDFVLPVLLTFFIAIASMVYHTVKASQTSPVESIKQR